VGGTIRLLPKKRRARIREVFGEAGETLRHWLVGRAILMALNGGLTALGLWLLGTPLALTLGILTGLLNFIPNVGPLIAGIPAVLIAWTQGGTQALHVFLLYLVLQNVDGYVLTPLVQQRTVSLPPALTILAQLLLGILAGTLGLLLATPLAAAALVFVKRLYVEDVLGDREDEESSD
jgi:predicted PurR-regulated permease PerM